MEARGKCMRTEDVSLFEETEHSSDKRSVSDMQDWSSEMSTAALIPARWSIGTHRCKGRTTYPIDHLCILLRYRLKGTISICAAEAQSATFLFVKASTQPVMMKLYSLEKFARLCLTAKYDNAMPS